MNGILVIDGEKSEPVSLGGYKISLSASRGFGTAAPKPDSEAELGAGVSSASRAMPSDKSPFAIVVNTAPDEFLFIGANGDPVFTIDSGPERSLSPPGMKGAMKTESGLPAADSTAMNCLNQVYPKLNRMSKVKLMRIQ